MASTIKDWETNKNAVIVHYPHLYPNGPAYESEKPTGCVIKFCGYKISASIFEKGFRVSSILENFSKSFETLEQAKQFAIYKYNKKQSLFW